MSSRKSSKTEYRESGIKVGSYLMEYRQWACTSWAPKSAPRLVGKTLKSVGSRCKWQVPTMDSGNAMRSDLCLLEIFCDM
jgi:hypothetical protein